MLTDVEKLPHPVPWKGMLGLPSVSQWVLDLAQGMAWWNAEHPTDPWLTREEIARLPNLAWVAEERGTWAVDMTAKYGAIVGEQRADLVTLYRSPALRRA